MLSLLSALTIQNRDVLVEAGGPSKEEKKYAGWIMLDVDRWHPILSTPPIYDSKEDAIKEMQMIVDAIKKADLSKEKEGLLDLLGEAAPIIMQIVNATSAVEK